MLQAGLHNLRQASVRITEVSPRDGLQHESEFVPTLRKISLINALSRTGVTEIEAGSFVSPAAIPQLADSERTRPRTGAGGRRRQDRRLHGCLEQLYPP